MIPKKNLSMILAKSEYIKQASDFKSWDMSDMSELFWMEIAKYVKEPNFKSLKLMERAWLWAVHEDGALANSFIHALHWIGVKDFYEEYEKHGWG